MLPEVEWRSECEAAVVGGGIVGLACAYWLARGGARTALVEQAAGPARGATGRSAGQLNPIGPAHPSRLQAQLGREATADLLRMLARSLALVEQVVAEETIECEFERVPLVHWARRATEWAELQQAAEDYRALGRPAELVARAGFHGGLFLPGHARCDPLALACGLAAAASRRGARLHGGTTLLSVQQRSDGGLELATSRGPLHAEFVVQATGWQAGDPAVFPVRGQMLVTAPAPPAIEGNCLSNAGYDYWHQRADGRVLIGGMRYLEPEMECGLVRAEINPRIEAALLRFLDEAYPELGGVTREASWSGIMAFTGDDLPLAGSLPGRARQLVAAGMCGHGLAYALATGEALAARIVGREVDYPWALFSPRRLL